MPTTASTATIRAWAHAEGLDVAERGRLKPEIVAAYAAANGSAGKSASRQKAARVTQAKATGKTTARKAAPKRVVSAAPVVVAPETAATDAEDPRIADLLSAVNALTERVARLEAAAVPVKPRTRRRLLG